ncbi:MAG TPA: GFA family protein [Paracoccaceae bacterium]|nr:GFA family protein [Paracoccaceae bacterium]
MSTHTRTEPTGGCQCGAVRYRVTQGFGDAGICHCRMCQRAAGNVFAPLVTACGVVLQGEPARWASSNIAERGFCAACGTPLFFRDFDRPEDEFEIMIGTLDDPDIAPPDHHYGVESRVAWLKMADGLPEYVTGGRGGTDPGKISSRQHPAGGPREE